MLCAGQAAAATTDTKSVAYYLPKLEAEITGSFTLVRCATKPEFKSEFTLAQKFVPDPFARVRLDTSVGFLAKRTVKVEYYPDGTLKTFNGSWEGKGGKVVTAAFKLASAVAGVNGTFLSGPCGDKADELLTRLAAVEMDIIAIESRLASSDAVAADLRARDVLLQRKAETLKALTVTKKWPVPVPYGSKGTCALDTYFQDGPRYETLLGGRSFPDLPGRQGIKVTLCLQGGFAGADTTGAAVQEALAAKQEDLIYRVPVPASLTVSLPNPSTGEVQSKSFPVSVPQWGELSRLRLGKGGLFGSREAGAKFDAVGMPSELSYGSASGADAISGLLDTGREGIRALGNSELAGLQAEIALEEARQKLAALRAAGSTVEE